VEVRKGRRTEFNWKEKANLRSQNAALPRKKIKIPTETK
jgi:hypothetical protein